jgi:hypothetical protein
VHSREEALTRRERAELQGYVSWTAVAGRAVLFALAVGAVGALSWRLQRWLPFSAPLWLLPTLAVAVFLYVRSRHWTGGRDLRNRIRQDLQTNTALVHHIQVREAIVFEEREDEGPIVFVLTDADETLVFTGQDLSRHVARGFPWREFEIREAAASRRLLRLERLGEPLRPSASKPPLSPEQFKQLGLGSVARWKRLDVPFEQLREVV